VRVQPARVNIVRCGAELVALTERLYGHIFAGAIVFCGLASLGSLALLPLRSTDPLQRPSPALVVAILVVVATPLALWHAKSMYRLVRRRLGFELVLVAASAALIIDPRNSELWWPSCALLMLLATLVPLPRALGYCLVVLMANLAAHVVARDLDETAPAAIVGLWIGYPLWTAAFGLGSDRLAAHVMRLNTERVAPRSPPRRVPTWTTPQPPAPEPSPTTPEPLMPTPPPLAQHAEPRDAPPGRLARLTARQLQVVALLVDGLRYRDIAACLSISVRQVERHVTHAVDRSGARNTYELVALAITEGLAPAHGVSDAAAG
jgi:DNA-binding CsgD family transcriptional regulator